MSPAVIVALLQYGPAALGIVQKLLDDFEKGRAQTTVTASDIAELQRLSSLTSAEIFRRVGVDLPAKPAV